MLRIHPGSRIQWLFDKWIRDPGLEKSGPGMGINILEHIFQSLVTIFWVQFFVRIRDPVLSWPGIRDGIFESGINFLDAQHWSNDRLQSRGAMNVVNKLILAAYKNLHPAVILYVLVFWTSSFCVSSDDFYPMNTTRWQLTNPATCPIFGAVVYFWAFYCVNKWKVFSRARTSPAIPGSLWAPF